MTLNDTAIAQIAKLIQIAMLTGTDVVDQLRTLKLTVVDDTITVDPNYFEDFNRNLAKMLEELNDNQSTDNTLESNEQLSLF